MFKARYANYDDHHEAEKYDEKRKNDDPKHNFVRTRDGKWLESVD